MTRTSTWVTGILVCFLLASAQAARFSYEEGTAEDAARVARRVVRPTSVERLLQPETIAFVATGGSGAASDQLEPGSYAWWEQKLSEKIDLSGSKSYPNGTHECMCKCRVVKPDSEDPFDCACKCPKHYKGDTGPAGPPGMTGPRGLVGLQGFQGPQGPRGSQGIKGLKGQKGDRGLVGLQGSVGANGRIGVGIRGPVGDVGDSPNLVLGENGPQGPDGTRGDTGDDGPAGSDWPGAAGPPGNPGAAGAAGLEGKVGPMGPEGPAGVRGPAGLSGGAAEVWAVKGWTGQTEAAGMCLSLNTAQGWVVAVPRSTSDPTQCPEICSNHKIGTATFECTSSIFIYSEVPSLQNNKAGIVARSYKTCNKPEANFCCCFNNKTQFKRERVHPKL